MPFHKVAIIIVLLILTIGLFVVWFIFRNDSVFSSSLFFTGLFNFLLALFSWILGFLTKDVFWARKQEREQTERLCDLLQYYLSMIQSNLQDSSQVLELDSKDPVTAIERDQAVMNNLRKLGDQRNNTLTFIDTSKLELNRNKRAAISCVYFKDNVNPVLERLTQYPHLRPGVENIKNDLKRANIKIEIIIRYLKGECNELDPSWGPD